MDGIGEGIGVQQSMKKRERGLELGVGVGVAVEIFFKNEGESGAPRAWESGRDQNGGGVEP